VVRAAARDGAPGTGRYLFFFAFLGCCRCLDDGLPPGPPSGVGPVPLGEASAAAPSADAPPAGESVAGEPEIAGAPEPAAGAGCLAALAALRLSSASNAGDPGDGLRRIT